MKRSRTFLALAVAAGALLAACSTGTTSQAPAETTDVRLQLQWVPQAQFAGYFAAAAEGYYEDEGLNVTFVPASPDIAPHVAGSATDGPEFTIAWVPKVLEARLGTPPSDLVNIAQVFQRSATKSVSWTDSNITSPADFAGKKVGVWDYGNEFEVTAAARKAGLEAGTDFEKVIQPFDMALLLSRDIDVAEAMIYNEYAQVLEANNPRPVSCTSPKTSTSSTTTTKARPCSRTRSSRGRRGSIRRATRTSRRASSRRRSRAGSSAATTPTSASSTPSTRVRRWVPATRRG